MGLYEFYRSNKWEKLLQILKLERMNEEGNIICEYCGKPIVRAYDCIGHHKTELTEENHTDTSISLNPDNIALVHHKCHNKIHNKLSYSHRQVFIVYGSPLSGKTSYVQEIAEEGDLMVDMDSIWQCISGCKRYVKPNRLKSIAFSVRDRLLEDIKYRRGKWLNAYVIGGYPFKAERERIASALGAREILISATKEECSQRLHNSEDRNTEEWEKYIETWWQQYDGEY